MDEATTPTPLPTPPPLSHAARWVIVVGVLCSFLAAFTGSALNVAIPTIGADFDAPAASLGWIVSCYNICTVVLLLPLGRLADLTSRRAVLLVGLTVFVVAGGLTPATTSLPQLIGLRVLQGVGAAGLFATQQAILAEAVPPQRRGAALGLTVSAVYVGLSAGPVLGGVFTRHFGWRSIFWFVTALGLATAAIAAAKLPHRHATAAGLAAGRSAGSPPGTAEPGAGLAMGRPAGSPPGTARSDAGLAMGRSAGSPPGTARSDAPSAVEPSSAPPPAGSPPGTAEPGAPVTMPRPLARRLDLPGMAIFMVGALGLTYGFDGLPDPVAYAALGLGLALLVVFVLHERRAAEPLLALHLFHAGAGYLLSNLSALLSYASTFAVSYLLAIYLTQVKGLHADAIGLILIVSPVCQAIVTPWTGRLSDRRSPFALASFGMALCAAGLVSFVALGASTPLAVVVVNLVVLGLGFAFFASPNTTAVMSFARPPDYGVVVSFLATMRNLGMVVAMGIIAVIVSGRFGQLTVAEAPVPLVVSTLRWCFAVFAVICLVGVGTSLAHGRRGAGGRVAESVGG